TALHDGSFAALTRSHTRPWHPTEHTHPSSAASDLCHGSTAAITADVCGSTVALTLTLRQPGGSNDTPPTEKQLYRLRIRDRIPNVAERTLTLTVTGEDVRLQDFRHTENTKLESLYTSLRALVTDVLARIRSDAGFWHTIQLAPGPDVTI